MGEQYESMVGDDALGADESPEADAELGDGSRHAGGVNINDGTTNT